ncbi:MAG: hypothetical protein U5P10_16370 [Spirochaetia bacterium]|nr:hypothetical protein [Spirochaetia bacterium]
MFLQTDSQTISSNMQIIYQDKKLSIPIENNILYENETYYIDLRNKKSKSIIDELYKNSLDKAVDYIPGNNFAKLRIRDYVGYLKLFDITYDLRTSKFIEDDVGENQYTRIVEEINKQISSISFKYDTPVYYYKNLLHKNYSLATIVEIQY